MKRAMNEFGPELQNIRLNHFRVDRISGADNDRHKQNVFALTTNLKLNATYTVPVLINNILITSLEFVKVLKTGCILVIHPVFVFI